MARACVYIAGLISTPDYTGVNLESIRHGIAVTATLMESDCIAPFPTFTNFVLCLKHPVSRAAFLDCDNAWLDKADAILLLSGWHTSKGACDERERAISNATPVFSHIETLQQWAYNNGYGPQPRGNI